MNKKTAIQLGIIIVAFSSAGLVLYNGLFKGSSSPVVVSVAPFQTSQQSQQQYLPYGNSLNFQELQAQGFIYNQVTLPQINPKTDFGIPQQNLILPKSPAS